MTTNLYEELAAAFDALRDRLQGEEEALGAASPETLAAFSALIQHMRKELNLLQAPPDWKPEPTPPGRKAYTRFRRRLLLRLRADGTREIKPGFPANVLADGLEEELSHEEGLHTIMRKTEELADWLRARCAARQEENQKPAHVVFHYAKHDATEPGSELGPAVRTMKHALRAEQGRRRRKR